MSSSLNFRICALIVIGAVAFLPISEQGPRIPVEFWKELWKMNSEEFVQKYVNTESRKSSYSEREDIQEGSVQNTKAAGLESDPVVPCYPMNTSVEVPTDPDPSVIRVPPCTVLPRCGGCCGSVQSIRCLPTSTHKVSVSVYRGVFDGSGFSFTPEILSMDAHTACDCMCSITPSDCNTETHVFDSSDCSCQCKNDSQAADCVSPKMWDESSCRCVCPHVQNCLDDEVFSFRTCTCERQIALKSLTSPEALTSCQCRPGYKAVIVSGKCVCQSPSAAAKTRNLRQNFPLSASNRRRR